MMTFRTLEAFRAIVLTGSVTNAASMLHISQPAVTRLIRDLEADLQFPLFHRRKGRLLATSEGLALFEEVSRSFVGLDRIAQVANHIRQSRVGHLQLATMPALINGFLPRVVNQFNAERPEVFVSMQVNRTQTVAAMVASQQCDLGFVALPAEAPGIDLVRQYHAQCVCILPPNHALTALHSITAADLEDQPFVALSQGTLTRLKVDAVLQTAAVTPNIKMETPLSLAAVNLVMEGMGISIIDPFTAIHHSRLGGAVRPFLPTVAFEYGVIFNDHAPTSGLKQAFLQTFEVLLNQYTQDHFCH